MSSVLHPTRRALLVVLVLLAGCGGTPAAQLVTPTPLGSERAAAGSASPGGSPPRASAATGVPTLVLEEPSDGATVPAGPFVIKVKASGIRLVAKQGSPSVAGEGHVLYYAGVDYIPTEPGKPAYTAAGTFTATHQQLASWSGLGPGKHVVAAQLVNNDDTPLQPPAVARATIRVQGGTPAPTRSDPQQQQGAPQQQG